MFSVAPCIVRLAGSVSFFHMQTVSLLCASVLLRLRSDAGCLLSHSLEARFFFLASLPVLSLCLVETLIVLFIAFSKQCVQI